MRISQCPFKYLRDLRLWTVCKQAADWFQFNLAVRFIFSCAGGNCHKLNMTQGGCNDFVNQIAFFQTIGQLREPLLQLSKTSMIVVSSITLFFKQFDSFRGSLVFSTIAYSLLHCFFQPPYVQKLQNLFSSFSPLP